MSPALRLSDDDRDRAAAELAEHFAAGRLDTEEHAERLDAIWSARTTADLAPIFEDLPATRTARATSSPRRTPARRGSSEERRLRGWHPPAFAVVLTLLIALSVITHLPFWLAIFPLMAVTAPWRHAGRSHCHPRSIGRA